MRKKLLPSEINAKIMDRGIQITGEYITAKIKTEFTCNNGHTWRASPNSVIRGAGCPLCNHNNKRSSKEEVNNRLANRGIQLTGEYIDSQTKTEFTCSNGHKWSAKPNAITNGKGCPMCAIGKGGGFKPSKPAWIYILIFDYYIKYGITNHLDRRLVEHLKNGPYTIATTKLYEDGRIAQNWERSIKIIFGGRFVSKEIMPYGYTETLSRDKLEALLDTII